jgi:DNA-directed RNA polymerase subunit M/transcription elongation factor TFIIS
MATSPWKPTKAVNPDFKCRECGSYEVEYSEWESSDGAYEDLHYRCLNCKRDWWVEGADA